MRKTEIIPTPGGWIEQPAPPLRRVTAQEVDALMEGRAVLVPVEKLKEWRRGLHCCLDHKGLGSIHAGEIIEEIGLMLE